VASFELKDNKEPEDTEGEDSHIISDPGVARLQYAAWKPQKRANTGYLGQKTTGGKAVTTSLTISHTNTVRQKDRIEGKTYRTSIKRT
jgi:hypothetical protein